MTSIRDFLLIVIGVLLAIDVHECAHAWSADKLGDPTGRYLGRITLNPIKHLDPLGTVMIVVSSYAGFGIGWGKPVPVNPHRLRYGPTTGMALVSLAGPAANLVTAFILVLPMRLGISMPYTLAFILTMLAYINVIIAVFNLIPLPPLDGFGVLVGIVSAFKSPAMRDVGRFLSQLETRGPIILLAVLMLSWVLPFNILGIIMDPPLNFFWMLVRG